MESSWNKDLECTFCHTFSVSPIHNCYNGHIACGICSDDFKQCNLCEEDLLPSAFSERLAKKHEITLPCRNSGKGCSKMVNSTEMKEHILNSCGYRPIICSCIQGRLCFGVFGNGVELKDYFNHLTTIHEIGACLNEKSGSFSETVSYMCLHAKAKLPIHLYTKKFDGNVFLKHRFLQGGNIYQWISVIGDEKVAQKYKFVINSPSKVPSTSSQIAKFTWVLPVVPIHESEFCKVQDQSQVASVHWKALVPFCEEYQDQNENKIYKYSWTENYEIVIN